MAKKSPAKGKKACIVCRQMKDGLPVAEDPVIGAIRKIKSRLGVAQGNILVVCEDDVEKALAKRSRFERYLMMLAFLAVVMFILVLLGSGSLLAGLLLGIVAACLVVALSFLIYYPGIEENALKEWKRKKGAAGGK